MMDASPLTLTMAAEEVAAGEMGIAVILDQCWKITRIIGRMATPELRETFFNDYFDDHRHILAIIFIEPENVSNYITDYEGTRLQTTAEKDGDEWVIDGISATSPAVPMPRRMWSSPRRTPPCLHGSGRLHSSSHVTQMGSKSPTSGR